MSNSDEERPNLRMLPSPAKLQRDLKRWYAAGTLVLAFLAAGFFVATHYDGLAKADHTHADLTARVKAVEGEADEDRHRAEEDRRATREQFQYIQDKLDRVVELMNRRR